MSRTILAGALVASVLLVLPFAGSADSGHGDKADKPSEGRHRGGHGVSTPEPTGLAAAWMALVAVRDAIAGDIEGGALGEVHEKAEPLPELVAALLEQSGDLDANKRTRVEGAAKQVVRVADALHKAADGGDPVRTRKQLSRLDGLLKLIRAQYPAGALDEGKHGHEGHSVAPGDARPAHAHMDLPAGLADVVHLHVLPGVTEAATYQLDEPGTYPVLCTIPGHTEGGTVGELVVLADHAAGRSHS